MPGAHSDVDGDRLPLDGDGAPLDGQHVGLDLLEHVRLIGGIVQKAVERFDSDTLWQEIGRAGALHLQQEVKALGGLVRDLQGEADRLLIAAMEGERTAEVDGRMVEVRRAYKRTWDTPLLAGAVAASVLQGERLPEVDTVVEALVNVARMEWRVTELEKLGIKDEDYCTKELGRATVTIQ